ncbi:hypothetical protein F5146DRAFT_1060307 [Armillaria mellea]|nr:hypothetical protein F5146DRAFT_1060307 [Armillaria mellea]
MVLSIKTNHCLESLQNPCLVLDRNLSFTSPFTLFDLPPATPFTLITMYRRSHPSAAEEAMSLLHSSPTSGTTSDQAISSVSMLLPPKKRSLSKMPSYVFKLKSGSGSKETSCKDNPVQQWKCALPEHVDVENVEAVLATISGNSYGQPSSGLQLSPVSLGYLELSGDQRRPSLSPLSEGFDDTRVVPLAPFPRVNLNPLPSAFSSDREVAPEFINPFSTPLFPPSSFGRIVLIADSARYNDDPFSPGPATPLGKTRQVKGKALIILGEEVGNFPGNDMQES